MEINEKNLNWKSFNSFNFFSRNPTIQMTKQYFMKY